MTATPSPRHHTKRRILRNTSANAVAQAASMLATFIFLPLLVHAFGIGGYGVMALATSVSTFAMLLDLGVSATLVRLVAERNARGDHRGLMRGVLSAAVIYAAIGAVVAIVMVVLGVFGPSLFRLTPAEADLLRTLLWIGAALQLWYWPTSVAGIGLSGMQRYDLAAGVALVTVVADIAGIVFVLVSHHGPVALVAIRAAEVVAGSLASIVLFVGLLPAGARRVAASLADVKVILRSGSPIFVLQVANVMMRQQADKIVLAVFVGPAAVGLYEIAAKLVTLVSTVMSLCASAVLPVATELSVSREHDALRSLFLRGSKMIATVAAPIIVVLIAIAGPFVAAWCGPGFVAVVPVAQILLLSRVLLPVYELGDQVLVAKGRFGLLIPSGLTCAVVNVVLSVGLVRVFGIVGVALGTLGAMALEFPWYARVFGKEMALPIGQWLRLTAWPIYPLLAVPALLAYAGGLTFLRDSVAGLAVVGAASVGTFWAIALFAAYSPVERADLLSIIRPSAPSMEAAS